MKVLWSFKINKKSKLYSLLFVGDEGFEPPTPSV
jgi:hypothetical protein